MVQGASGTLRMSKTARLEKPRLNPVAMPKHIVHSHSIDKSGVGPKVIWITFIQMSLLHIKTFLSMGQHANKNTVPMEYAVQCNARPAVNMADNMDAGCAEGGCGQLASLLGSKEGPG